MPPASQSSSLYRVVLTGAESTGKTTLAALLADHYGTIWTPEYVRAFVEEKGLPTYDDVARIAQGHLDQERHALPRARRLLIYDTDLLSTYLYSHHYFGRCPAWVEQASYDHEADLYLLAGDDIPWMADPGQRESPALRATLQAQFQDELDRRGLPYIFLHGPVATRMETAITAIDALL